MTPPTEQELEAALMNAAQFTRYPPTPDVAARVTRRLYRRSPVSALARAAAVLLILFAALFAAVPEIRAAVLSALRIGAVTLIRETPTPDPRGDRLESLLQLENPTTLAAARVAVPFVITLPAYPADLGQPDRVYLPAPEMAAMLWIDGDRPRLVLTIHTLTNYAMKYYPWQETNTHVGTAPAVWLTEPHSLYIDQGDGIARRIVNTHVLLWVNDGLTYRLETDAALDEALRIAESLR